MRDYYDNSLLEKLNTFISSQKQLPEEFNQVVNEKFFELLSNKAEELHKCSGVVKEWAESIKAEKE